MIFVLHFLFSHCFFFFLNVSNAVLVQVAYCRMQSIVVRSEPPKFNSEEFLEVSRTVGDFGVGPSAPV